MSAKDKTSADLVGNILEAMNALRKSPSNTPAGLSSKMAATTGMSGQCVQVDGKTITVTIPDCHTMSASGAVSQSQTPKNKASPSGAGPQNMGESSDSMGPKDHPHATDHNSKMAGPPTCERDMNNLGNMVSTLNTAISQMAPVLHELKQAHEASKGHPSSSFSVYSDISDAESPVQYTTEDEPSDLDSRHGQPSHKCHRLEPESEPDYIRALASMAKCEEKLGPGIILLEA